MKTLFPCLSSSVPPNYFSLASTSAHRFHPGCHPHPWHKSFRGQRCTQRPIYYQAQCKVSYKGKWSLHWSGRENRGNLCNTGGRNLSVLVSRQCGSWLGSGGFSCVSGGVFCCIRVVATQEGWQLSPSSPIKSERSVEWRSPKKCQVKWVSGSTD